MVVMVGLDMNATIELHEQRLEMYKKIALEMRYGQVHRN